jgi:hypothetical protein
MRLLLSVGGGLVAVATVLLYSYVVLLLRQTFSPGRGLTAAAGGGNTFFAMMTVVFCAAAYICWIVKLAYPE